MEQCSFLLKYVCANTALFMFVLILYYYTINKAFTFAAPDFSILHRIILYQFILHTFVHVEMYLLYSKHVYVL